MFKPLKRPNCKMIGGDPAYIGQTGLIVDRIDSHFRIVLDRPRGDVTEGRWLPREVALIRPPKGWVAPEGFEHAMSAMPPLPAPKPAKPEAKVKLIAVGGKPVDQVDPASIPQMAAESASDAPVIEERTETRLQEAEAVLAEAGTEQPEQGGYEPGVLTQLGHPEMEEQLAVELPAEASDEVQHEGRPDVALLTVAIEAIGGKGGKKRKGRKDGKPKALSAKQAAQAAAGVKVTKG